MATSWQRIRSKRSRGGMMKLGGHRRPRPPERVYDFHSAWVELGRASGLDLTLPESNW